MPPILKLSAHDGAKELEFELNYLLSLTTRQRFEMMFRKSREIRALMKSHGNRKAPKIIKRS